MGIPRRHCLRGPQAETPPLQQHLSALPLSAAPPPPPAVSGQSFRDPKQAAHWPLCRLFSQTLFLPSPAHLPSGLTWHSSPSTRELPMSRLFWGPSLPSQALAMLLCHAWGSGMSTQSHTAEAHRPAVHPSVCPLTFSHRRLPIFRAQAGEGLGGRWSKDRLGLGVNKCHLAPRNDGVSPGPPKDQGLLRASVVGFFWFAIKS